MAQVQLVKRVSQKGHSAGFNPANDTAEINTIAAPAATTPTCSLWATSALGSISIGYTGKTTTINGPLGASEAVTCSAALNANGNIARTAGGPASTVYSDSVTTTLGIGTGTTQTAITIGGGLAHSLLNLAVGGASGHTVVIGGNSDSNYAGTTIGHTGVTDAFNGAVTIAEAATVTGAVNANGGVARSTSGTASLFADNNTTTITIGGGTANTGITIGRAGYQTTVLGDLTVNGTTYTTHSEDILIASAHLHLNVGYTGTSGHEAAIVVTYKSEGTTDTIASGGFVAATGGNNPKVFTTNNYFAVGDILQVSGANTQANNGIYEVLSNSGGVLKIRSNAGSEGAPTLDFVQDTFTNDSSTTGTLTRVYVTLLHSDASGDWGRAKGYNASSFSSFTSLGGTLQEIYNASNPATIDTGTLDRAFEISGDAAAITFKAGTSAVNIGTDATAGQINIGTGTGSHPVAIGNNTSGGAVNINSTAASYFTVKSQSLTLSTDTSGTLSVTSAGTLALAGASGGTATLDAGTISIGSTTGGTINIGNVAGTTAIHIGDVSGQSKTINIGNTNTGSSLLLYGGTNGVTMQASSGSVSITATGAGIMTLQTAAGNLNLQTSTGYIYIGRSASCGTLIGDNNTYASQVTVGNNNSSSSVTIEGGTSSTAIQIGNGATAHGIQIGTGAAVQTIVIGSTNSTSSVTIHGGTGTSVNIGTTGAKTVTIGNITSACNVDLRAGATEYITLYSYNGSIKVGDSTGYNLDGNFANTSIIGALNELMGLTGVVRNTYITTGISVGSPVYITSSSTAGTVAAATATADAIAANVFGFVTSAGASGKVVSDGIVNMLFKQGDTAPSNGAEIYLHTSAGYVIGSTSGFTTNNVIVPVGYLKDATNLSGLGSGDCLAPVQIRFGTKVVV